MENKIIKILTKVGAILPNSHFVGTSGRHFDTYLTKDALFPHTAETSEICKFFAEKTKHLEMDIVAAPALGGLIFSQWIAYHLSQLKGKEILAVFTEKTSDNNQILTRGYNKLVQGKKVLAIEDFTTTGGSVKRVVDSVKKAGGNVIGVCVMINKDPVNVNSKLFGVPFTALADLVVKNYNPDDCPLCRKEIPINTTFGHGKKFLESKKQKEL